MNFTPLQKSEWGGSALTPLAAFLQRFDSRGPPAPVSAGIPQVPCPLPCIFSRDLSVSLSPSDLKTLEVQVMWCLNCLVPTRDAE